MQQQSINFEGYTLSPKASTHTWKQRYDSVKSAINKWLDSKSEFYSRIAEFAITRRAAIRLGVVLPLAMIVAAVCVEQAPLVSIVAASVSGWIVYRLNHNEKGGKE